MDREDILKLLPIPGLPAYLNQIDKMMSQSVSATVFGKDVSASISHGKRLRPLLLIASAQLGGQKIDQKVIKLAAAIELIHKASLVHDDLIDGDGQLPPDKALLIGDFLIAAGLEQAAIDTKAVTILTQAIKAMSEGQAQQFMPEYKADTTSDFYMKTVKNKTAALFCAACQLGSLYREYTSQLSAYGEAFGIVFQIIDDISDGEFDDLQTETAVKVARKYLLIAKNSLAGLPASELRDSLADLPQIIFDTAPR